MRHAYASRLMNEVTSYHLLPRRDEARSGRCVFLDIDLHLNRQGSLW